MESHNMPHFLKSPFVDGPGTAPLEVLVRLLIALALGALVTWIYRATRKNAEPTTSVGSIRLYPLRLLYSDHLAKSNPGPVGHDTVFGNDDDPVANVIKLVVHVV